MFCLDVEEIASWEFKLLKTFRPFTNGKKRIDNKCSFFDKYTWCKWDQPIHSCSNYLYIFSLIVSLNTNAALIDPLQDCIINSELRL